MADLIAYQNGNWTGATTWKGIVTDAGAKQATISNSNNAGLTYTASSAFTIGNGVVVEGILMYCNRAGLTGTTTIGLSEDNGSTYVREITVNVSALPAQASWVFFKFSSTLTGDGGTDYRVAVKSNFLNNATFYRDGTAGNWARYLRTSTTATAAATDVTFICDEMTGASNKTNVAVTMDSTSSATTYGAVNIGFGGELNYGTTASTNYYLKLAGNLTVFEDGQLNIGTTGTPIPRSSTAVLQLASTSANQYGIILNSGSTFRAQGLSRTAGNDSYFCLLNTDEAINSTSLGVDRDTGWLDNDAIAVAPTTVSHTGAEKGNLNGNAGANTLTVDGFGGTGGGLQFAHTGTGIFAAEVVLLTRNVQIFGGSATNTFYVSVGAGAVVDWDWAEFYWSGTSWSGSATTMNFNMNYCSMWDSYGIEVRQPDVQFTNNVMYNCTIGFYTNVVSVGSEPVTGPTVTGNVFVRMNTTGQAFRWQLARGTYNNNRIAGAASNSTSCVELGYINKPLTGLVIHSIAGGASLRFQESYLDVGVGEITDCTFWLVNGIGVAHGQSANALNNRASWRYTNCEFTGVSTAVSMNEGAAFQFLDCTFSGHTSQSMLYSLTGGNGNATIDLKDCVFRAASGVYTLANTNLFIQASGTNTVMKQFNARITADNTLFNASANVLNLYGAANNDARFSDIAFFSSQRHNQTSGSHRTQKRNGLSATDTTIFKTASPSERLTPNNASEKMVSGTRAFAVASGTTATVRVWVRESVVGDGTDYNGARARLMLRRLDSAGITSTQVLATATVASEGAWQQLTGTTPTVTADCVLEVYVDCDGTTGWVNVDDWSIS